MKIQKSVFIVLSTILLCTCVIKEELPPNPIADFEIINTKEGKVTFRNTSQNASTYLWNFGDNNISNEVTPTHTYTRKGTYRIILIAYGFETDTISKQVQIIFNQPLSPNQSPTDILLSNDTILENQPVGTLIGILSTLDPNSGDTHIYSLVAGIGDADNSSFIISGDELKSNEAFDYEMKNIYSIRVKSEDQNGKSIEKSFTIKVTDGNEPPTDILLSNDTILENQLVGTLIGTLSTVDPNSGDTHIYSLVAGIGDADNSSFTIDGDELKSNEIFDYEMKDTYSIRVKSEDQGGESKEKSFSICIKDIAGRWHSAVNTVGWGPRIYHSSVVFKGKIWVIGGTSSVFKPPFRDVWYSDNGINWTNAIASAPWSGRHDHTSVVFAGEIWIIGGEDNSNNFLKDVWHSDNGTNWRRATSSAAWGTGWSRGRAAHTSVVHNGKMWLIGGFNENFSQNDVWHSINGRNWRRATSSAGWTSRFNHASVIFNNEMWIMGGLGGSTFGSDAWHSDNGGNWIKKSLTIPSWEGRWGLSAVVYDNEIWIMGGINSSHDALNDAWYSNNGKDWIRDTSNPRWTPRTGHSSVVFDNKIWILGGGITGNRNDIWYYEKDY